MVADTSVIVCAEEGTFRFQCAILSSSFKQKVKVSHAACFFCQLERGSSFFPVCILIHFVLRWHHGAADDEMVQRVPFPLEEIGAADALCCVEVGGKEKEVVRQRVFVGQERAEVPAEEFLFRQRVHVARDDNQRVLAHVHQTVDASSHFLRNEISEVQGRLSLFSAWQVTDEDVQRVTRHEPSRRVEHVACGAQFVGRWCDAERIVFNECELFRLKEQCHVDAADIVGMRHDIVIAQSSQGSALREMRQHGVVFHFAERHQCCGL